MSGEITEGGVRVERVDGRDYPYIKLDTPTSVDKHFYPRGHDYIIDFEQSPTLQKALEALQELITEGESEEQILAKIRSVITGVFPEISIPVVERLHRKLRASKQGSWPSLENYAEVGVGNCSQTSLSAMLLYEKLRDHGRVSGEMILEEASWDSEFASGSHTWAKFLLPEKPPVVLDIVRNFMGSEEDHKGILKEVEWEIKSQ